MAWDEVRNGVRSAAFSRVEATTGGAPAFAPIQTLDTGTSAYPVLAAVPNGWLAVWTAGPPDRAVISVRVVR